MPNASDAGHRECEHRAPDFRPRHGKTTPTTDESVTTRPTNVDWNSVNGTGVATCGRRGPD
ncbi:hypothetical protein [Haladaptatus sp. NG-WS-4]